MPAPPNRAWAILALAAFIALANYLHTATFVALLNTEGLRGDFRLSNMFAAFSAANISGAILGGIAVWLLGARWAVLGALVVWILSAILASAGGGASLVTARGLHGFAAPALLIGSYQAIAEWIPRGFHGLSVALVRALPVIAVPIVGMYGAPWVKLGLQTSFLAIAVLGVILAVLWVTTVTPRPGMPPPDRVNAGGAALASPVSWGLIVGVFLIGMFSSLLFSRLQIAMQQEFRMPSSIVPTAVSVVAMIVGALFSDVTIQSGVSAGTSRGITTLIAGGMMLTVVLLAFGPASLLAVAVLSLVFAGYQMWSVVMYAAAIDAVPPAGVGLVAGVAMFLSSLGSVIISVLIPRALGALSVGGIAFCMGVLALLALTMSALVWRIPRNEVS